MKDQSEEKKKRDTAPRGLRLLCGTAAVSAAALMGIGLALPLRPTYSASEKRSLADFPTANIASLLSGTYFTELGTWFSDTFPFREVLLSAGSRLEGLYGPQGDAYYGNKGNTAADEIPEAAESLAPVMTRAADAENAPATGSEVSEERSAADALDRYAALVETNEDGTLKIQKEEKAEVNGEQAGNIYVTNHCGYEIYYYNQGGAVKYASMINTYKATFPDCEIYDILVPNSFGVELDTGTQAALGSSNMQDGFNYIFSMMDPAVHRISMFDTLSAHKDEYIYFHTDHHWTGLGAYYAYTDFCREKGITAHALSEYRKESFPGFYGTFYFSTNRSEALKQNPDTVEAWVPMATNDMQYVNQQGEQGSAHVINDMSEANAGDKYSTFIFGDHPLTVIHNPTLDDGSACVLIKESYGNAFAPYLVDHYEDVYVVDYRHFQGNLRELIRECGIQDILFLNNAQALTEKASGQMLGLLG